MKLPAAELRGILLIKSKAPFGSAFFISILTRRYLQRRCKYQWPQNICDIIAQSALVADGNTTAIMYLIQYAKC